MQQLIKILAVILALASISCNADIGELNFLQEGGSPITLEACMENPTFKVVRSIVDPPEATKGTSIKIKVQGIMQSDQIVKELYLQTLYNEGEIFVDHKDMKNADVKKGKVFMYDYEAAVPTFTPSGKWEIFLRLKNSGDEVIGCLKATFIME